METEPGARGIIIGDRYRVAGALRRTGLIDAVDLEADRGDAACRIVGVPGDAERVDAWEDAWRAAQGPARLPRLREVLVDDDGAHWAVLEPSRAVSLALPSGADTQARAIGAALAEAGLDVADVTRGMLAGDEEGRLIIDGTAWLGGALSPQQAGRALAALLPPAFDAAHGELDEPAEPVRERRASRASARRPRRTRLLLPLSIVAVLAAAVAVLVLPARSTGTAEPVPLAPTAPADALLGGGAEVLAVGAMTAAPERKRRPRRPVAVEPQAPPVETVTVVVEAQPAPAEAAPSTPEAIVPELPPVAAPAPAPALPLASATEPPLPVAADG